MKVNSEVKKDNQGIEQKTLRVKLRLSKETIRELKESELRRAVGGDKWTAASKQVECCAIA